MFIGNERKIFFVSANHIKYSSKNIEANISLIIRKKYLDVVFRFYRNIYFFYCCKTKFNMQQATEDFEIIPPARPLFLKVLCILTFIGSGYGIINSAITYFKADDISNIVSRVTTEVNQDAKRKNSRNPEKFN